MSRLFLVRFAIPAFVIFLAYPLRLSARSVMDIKPVPKEVLKRSVSPEFFRSLAVSPVAGWIVVRGQLAGTHLSGSRVVHSEGDGAYDSLALETASEMELKGYNTIGLQNARVPVVVHVLIYQIADGKLVLSFPVFDGAGENQLRYYGCARLVVLQKDNRRVAIKGPPGLEGKGWAVRRGLADSFEAQMKLEKVFGVAGFSPGG